MTAHFTLVLDTVAPAIPTLTINNGATLTASPVVVLTAFSPSTDVAQIKVWGDLDMADLAFGTIEAESAWQIFSPEIYVQTTAGTERKNIYARLRDDCGNATPVFGAWIDLDTISPLVSIVSGPDTDRISAMGGFNLSTFAFTSTLAFTAWQVRVVQSAGAPHGAGILVASGAGTFGAGDPVSVTLTGGPLQTAAPGNGPKIIKCYVNTASGWSP